MEAAFDLLAALAISHPRLAGALSLVMLVLGVVGLVCAQLDPDVIEAAGWPRLAQAVRWGAQIGALAVVLGKSKRRP